MHNIVVFFRRKKLEEDIQKMSWMIDFDELDFIGSASVCVQVYF